MTTDVVTLIIGRNEGARLVRCLASVRAAGTPIVYVDSGSTDDSVAEARKAGAHVVELDMSRPFTAARARNAGLETLAADPPRYVQFLDGDCELERDWIATARAFLDDNDKVAAVSGRLRERFPEATIYNRLADAEWDTPVGQADACGGIVMMRHGALDGVGGFNPSLIAGEEPELCVRLRRQGWVIWRLDADMALHDIAMTRFSQWWRRSRRAGHAFAEGHRMHGAPPERMNADRVRRAVVWGLALPLACVVGAVFVSPWALLLALAWPVQIARLRRQGLDLTHAVFLTLGKLPEAQGILGYWLDRILARPARIIEYK